MIFVRRSTVTNVFFSWCCSISPRIHFSRKYLKIFLAHQPSLNSQISHLWWVLSDLPCIVLLHLLHLNEDLSDIGKTANLCKLLTIILWFIRLKSTPNSFFFTTHRQDL